MTETQARARILAEFVPQAWVNDVAICVDPEGETQFDVTDAILAMSRESALAIKDDDYAGDNLRDFAPEWAREWSGPFYVRVEQAIADYFDAHTQGESPKPTLRWTAGPWDYHVGQDYGKIEGAGRCLFEMQLTDDGKCEADLQLASAAPDMASALQDALDMLPDLPPHDPNYYRIERMRAALKKAGAL